ncbi:MAG: hypothetical protein SGI92_17830 [Bryobacteraceae bacterium]|nr:hypothetical protein [Bryobacteraceae bacterium]
MPSSIFEDDPSIPATERLFRRIPATWVDWDEQGNAAISSAAFKDEELSITIESVLTIAGRAPEDVIRNYPRYGLAAITAGHARSLNQAVARDPEPEEPAHGVVYGQKKRRGIGGKLRDGAEWVVRPTKSETG